MLSWIVGALLGFFSGLGVGGGSLLILWLTLVLETDPRTAGQINLLYFVPCALASSAIRSKRAKFPWKLILPAAAAGCAGAILGIWLGNTAETELLKKLFGVLLLAAGIRELLCRPKQKQGK